MHSFYYSRRWSGPALLGLFLLLAGNSATAALKFSYNADLTDSRILNGAHVESRKVYITSDAASGNGSQLSCCTWKSGPGAGDVAGNTSVSANASGAYEVNLSALPAGSVRAASLNGTSESFTISRPAGYQPVLLASSGPLNITQDNQVIENLSITAGTGDGCAIRALNVSNLTIRNVDIRHANIGICAQDVSNLVINDVRLSSTSAPAAGPHCDHGVSECKFTKSKWANPDNRLAIKLNRAPASILKRISINKASGGVFTYKAHNTKIYDVVCTDIRGPYPRGQCVQFVNTNDALLKNFYSKIWKNQSRSEDNVNMYQSDNVLITDGFIDGNYSINGVGVIADTGSDNAHVRNIDLINTTVVAISVWSNDEAQVGKNFLAENIRAKDTHCDSRDGYKPSSQGLVFGMHPKASNPRYVNTQYFNHCRSTVTWCVPGSYCSKGIGGSIDIREADFTPKAALALVFPWESRRPVITELTVQ